MKSFIKSLKLFESVDVDQVSYSIKDYSDGSIIKLAGERNDKLGLVYKGQAVMQHIGLDGQLMTVTSFKVGETFGGNRIFCSNNKFPLTISAKGSTSIIYFSKDMILSLCQSDQNFLVEYLKDIANKSDILSLKIRSATFVTLEERIIKYLNTQYKIQGTHKIVLQISKKEWAEQLGVQRTSLSRALQRMKKKGWLSYKNHHFTLLNYDIFKHLSQQ